MFKKQRLLAVNFARGSDTPDAESIMRRLHPQLAKAGFLTECTHGGKERTIQLVQEKRDQLTRFMRSDELSEELRVAVHAAVD